MKRKINQIAVALLLSGAVVAAKAQQTRSVGDFTGLKMGDSFDITLAQSDVATVRVDAPENMQSRIKTEVKDGILTVSADGNLKTGKDVKIVIGVKSLTSIDLTGAADVKSENQLVCDKLLIKSTGAGDVHLDVKANEIRTEISGAGDVTLKGSAQLINAEISGAGDLKASGLEADKGNIKVSGAGTAKVNVKQSLDADVSGAGSIIYKGNPTERNVNITGAGSVRESKSGNGEETANDTTKFKLGKKKYMIIGDNNRNDSDHQYTYHDSLREWNRDFRHWNGLDLGVSGLMDYKNTLDVAEGASFMELNYAKSLQVGINIFEKDFHIYKNYINLVTGIGLDFNHYAFKNNTSLHTDTIGYLFGSKDSVSYKKNTLNVSYIKVPLMIEINTSKNPHNDFHIAGGVEAEYRIHSVTKQQFTADDHHYKVKQRDDFNLEPFLFNAVVRIGYNHVSLYANYALNRLFQKDKGPQEYPFSVGITIGI